MQLQSFQIHNLMWLLAACLRTESGNTPSHDEAIQVVRENGVLFRQWELADHILESKGCVEVEECDVINHLAGTIARVD